MAAGVVTLALGVASLLVSFVVADGGSVKFEYTGNGPANWGNLSPEYRTCSTGTHQSPINIVKNDAHVHFKHDLYQHYINANATLINHGYSLMVYLQALIFVVMELISIYLIMLKFDQGAGFILQEGKNYTLMQLHWHTPSEHTIDNHQFPLEIHIVHTTDKGDIAVVAILYDLSETDPFINQLKDGVTKLAKEHISEQKETHVQVGIVITKSLKLHTHKYFKYAGSLTTPPCTESVTWYILGKVRKVSMEQIALIRSPLALEFHNNSRPTQPLNGRVIELYDESKSKLH